MDVMRRSTGLGIVLFGFFVYLFLSETMAFRHNWDEEDKDDDREERWTHKYMAALRHNDETGWDELDDKGKIEKYKPWPKIGLFDTKKLRPGEPTDNHTCDTIYAVPADLRNSSLWLPHGLDYFWQKFTSVYGIPVIGSYQAKDSAIKRACYVARFLLADNYPVRESYYKHWGRFAVIGRQRWVKYPEDHEFIRLMDFSSGWYKPRTLNKYSRGRGATLDRPISWHGEENALCDNSDDHALEDMFLHMFAHGIYKIGIKEAIPGFHKQLRFIYAYAIKKGRWEGTSAALNIYEYWVKGVQIYFNTDLFTSIVKPNGYNNHVNTREELKEYDPYLYSVVKNYFECENEYIQRCNYTCWSNSYLYPCDDSPWITREAEENQTLTLNCDGSRAVVNNKTEMNLTTPIPTVPPTTTPTTPGCADFDERCLEWAASEHEWCDKAWMRTECALSCTNCTMENWDDTCYDTHRNCNWLYRFELWPCTDHTLFTQCKRTCHLCYPMCVDTNEHCEQWASQGWCQRKPEFMLPHCAVSCDACDTHSVTTPVAPKICVDIEEDCEMLVTEYDGCNCYAPDWCIYDFCEEDSCDVVNRNTMKFCPFSCDTCPADMYRPTTTTTTTTPDPDCMDEEDECAEWAHYGHCDFGNWRYMNEVCRKSCRRCSQHFTTTTTPVPITEAWTRHIATTPDIVYPWQ